MKTKDVFLIHKLVERQVAIAPKEIAIIDQSGTHSYQELDLLACRIANLLHRQGIKAGDIVGVSLDRQVHMVATLLAIMKLGASYLPLDPSYPVERLLYMIEDAQLKFICIEPHYKKLFKNSCGHLLQLNNLEQYDPIFISNDKDCRVYLIYTSGSTGKPKGVELFHHNLRALFQWMPQHTRLLECNRTLQFSPLSFDPSFMEIFTTLSQGKTLVLIDGELRKDPSYLLSFIIQQNIDRLFIPIVVLHAIAAEALERDAFPGQLKEINCGGDTMKVNRDVVEFCRRIVGVELNNQYGPTETAIMVTHNSLKGDPYAWPKSPALGNAISEVELKILDEQLQEGRYGELYIGGECIAPGYFNREQLTQQRFVTLNGKRFYRSGDLVRYDEKGELFFVGRIDNQVKINGIRIELGEVEKLISAIEQVKDSVAVVKDDRGIKRFIAYYIGSITSEQVKDILHAKLPANMRPHFIIQLDHFPVTPTGKVDRKALPLPNLEKTILDDRDLSQDEQLLKKLWEDVLKVQGISLQDNFFDVGGNSLLAMKLIAKIRKEFQVELPVVQFFQFPTIEKLANSFQHHSRKRKRQNNSQKKVAHRKVAVVGMACHFPGAPNLDAFWDMILNNQEGITFFKDEELNPFIPLELRNHPNYIKARGFIEGIDQFDPSFWGMSPLVAQVMDPQLRIILEYAHKALEHGGCVARQFEYKVGVFAGMSNNTYYANNVMSHPDKIARVGEWTVATLNEKDYVATQIAYRLGLTGPALSIHSACSTSLVAIAQAIKAIEQGECNAAVAGGINIDAISHQGYLYQEGSIRSQDGHCRPFDKDSSGTIFCDGVGMVVLKELKQAQKDGDIIYAVIKGAAINNDGSDKMSFTAPSVNGQKDVIEMALADQGVDPLEIGLVEAHGTATPVGDPIEIEALRQAWQVDRKQYAILSSVKGNVGHMIGAAGVAGFIKSVLAIYHQTLPPTNHFTIANPMLDIENSPFKILNKPQPWKHNFIAAVSAFGVGGTNAHILVGKGSLPNIKHDRPRSRIPILLTAKTQSSLQGYHELLRKFLQQNITIPIENIAYTLFYGREHYLYQSCFFVDSTDDLIRCLAIKTSVEQTHKHKLIWAFSGQGSQYLGMGRSLYKTFAVFKESCDHCFSILRPLLKRDLQEVMFYDQSDDALKNTYYTQPAIFVLQFALVSLVRSWGIQPDILLGHSIGELCAAVVAEVLSLEDALNIIAKRSELMSVVPAGDMLSVPLTLEKAQVFCNDEVQIAAVNGPKLTVLAGPTKAIDQVIQQLQTKGLSSKKLHTSHAFHSNMMKSMAKEFALYLQQFEFHVPKISFYSTVLNCFVEQEIAHAEYWAEHVVKGVLFAPAIDQLMEVGDFQFLEFGPRGTLSVLMQQQNRMKNKQWRSATLLQSSPDDELNALYNGLSKLIIWQHCKGEQFVSRAMKVALPSYCYDYRTIWLDAVKKDIMKITSKSKRQITRKRVVKDATTIIQQKIIELLAESSGLSTNEITTEESFMELGFDSLSLTQVAQDLSKEFSVEISFRKLMGELQTAKELTNFIISVMPADKREALAEHETIMEDIDVVSNINDHFTPDINLSIGTNLEVSSSVRDIVNQQLEIMRQQITILAGATSGLSPAQPVSPSILNKNLEQKTKDENNIVDKADNVEIKEVKATVNTHKTAFGAQARIKVEKEIDPQEVRDNIEQFMQEYIAKTKKSKNFSQKYRAKNADPRVVTGFRPEIKEIIYPIVVNRSKAQHLWDLDGNEYVDMICGFGSNFFGNQNPRITQALHDQLDHGFEIGPQHELVGECAELICEFTHAERAAFCNTGSEAVLGALRCARSITGKTKVVMFKGSYHGINDEVIVRGPGNGVAMPAAAGISRLATQDIILLDYGTDEALRIIKDRIDELAAVITESVQSRRTDFRPKEFLQEVRAITEEHGVALIFDEVITGFRIRAGGAQEYYGIQADLGTYGKIIGAGMPVGVIAGKKKFMDALDGGFWQYGDESYPSVGVTYFAGTFVRHPLTLRAMREALLILKEAGSGFYTELNRKADHFVERLNLFAQQEGAPIVFDHFGGVLKPRSLSNDKNNDLLFAIMRFNGVHAYDGFPWFITMAHTDQDLEFVEQCFKKSVKMMQMMGIYPTMLREKKGGKVLTVDDAGNPVWKDEQGKLTPYKDENNE